MLQRLSSRLVETLIDDDNALMRWLWLVWHFLLLLPLKNRESDRFENNNREKEELIDER